MANEASQRNVGFHFLLMASAFVIVIAGLKAAASVLLPVLVATFFAVLSIPPINWLRRRKLPTWAATLIIFLVVLVCFAVVSVYIGASIRTFSANLPEYQSGLQDRFIVLIEWLRPKGIDLSAQTIWGMLDTGRLTSMFGSALSAFGGILSDALFVILTMVFILAEATGLPRKIRTAMGDPKADLDRYSHVLEDLQAYLGIKTQVSLVTALAVGAVVFFVGVDFPFLWALLAFLLNFVPTLGSIIAAVPPALLAFVQFGWERALVVISGYLVVNLVMGNVVEPRLMGRRLGLSTLVVFLSLVFWGWVWGPVGMVLCVPLTMLLKILLENTEDLKWVSVLLGSGAEMRHINAPEESKPSAPPSS